MDLEEARKELPGSASPASDRAAEEGNCESQAPRQKPRLIGQYAGHLPDSSHNLVEQLMAQYAQLQEQEEEDTEAAAEEAKAAAAAAFRKAEALDVASDDAMLNYEKVVRSRLNREAASLVCVEDLDSFVDPAPYCFELVEGIYKHLILSAAGVAIEMPNPLVYIDEALLPGSRQTASSVKAWQLKGVDLKCQTISGAHLQGAYFTASRGSRLRTVAAVKRQGLEWTFAQSLPQLLAPPTETADDPQGAEEEEGEEPQVDRLQSVLPKVHRRRDRKLATMPARLGPKDELSSARFSDGEGKEKATETLAELRESVLKLPLPRPITLNALGEPDLPVVMRKKKKTATMPDVKVPPLVSRPGSKVSVIG
ncbi:unnamed protein product [Symbiodinium sp. CCMP2456]|nr:unnamed protein product [Symbiodinium sp. CCMP2456]